jgi:hypothetical protein
MSMELTIYAEVFDGAHWHAEPTEHVIEEMMGHLSGETWLEPQPLWYGRNDNLAEILGMRPAFRDLIQITPRPRGFPTDISNELLDHVARSHLPDWWQTPQDWVRLRQRAMQLQHGQSWFLLSELLSFDWHGHQQRHHGTVASADAALFGAGNQPFPTHVSVAVGDVDRAFAPCQPGYTWVSWVESYADKAGHSFMHTILTGLQALGPPDQVRVVCWLVG